MSVDMYARRFLQELRKLPPFEPNERRDPRVWPRPNAKEAGFAAWRALFSASILYGHSSGYRLPSFEQFFKYCERTFTIKHPDREELRKYFEGDLAPGMRQRIGVWYESGMAETFLYACLVEAIEDLSKVGVVLYDPRVDWKLKTDVVVLINGVAMRISAYVGDHGARADIEERRERIERFRKQNTPESAHWDNAQLGKMALFEIERTHDDMRIVNGLRLFSIDAVNTLLQQLYAHAGVANGALLPLR
jgi:hypothetical protein